MINKRTYIQRPYASKVAGIPEHSEFNPDTLEYTFSFRPFDSTTHVEQASNLESRTTEIYIPHYHFADQNLDVNVSDGTWKYEPELQTLYHYCHNPEQESITIRIKSPSFTGNSANSRCTVM